MTIFGLDLKTWLGLTVLAAVVSTLGALLGIVIKDYIFARSLERWKQKQTLEQIYQHFKDPLRLSTRELSSRFAEIIKDYPTLFLHGKTLCIHSDKQTRNSADDPYYKRYKLISTLYRFCAFLGWLELYRQEITFLPLANNQHTAAFDNSIALLRSDFADGHLNKAHNWREWRDTLIFREELRAVGEAMIETRGPSRTIIGYGRFCELFESEAVNDTKRWSVVVLNFLLDLQDTGLDFRRKRLELAFVHLVDLLELLDPRMVDTELIELRQKLKPAMDC